VGVEVITAIIRLFLKRSFLGAFKHLQKKAISFIMFVYPSVRPRDCPHGTGRLPLDNFVMMFGI
jgi:hypothetical protein